MPKGVLLDKTTIPDATQISALLQDSYPLWQELSQHIETTYPNGTSEWKYYGKAFGWALVFSSKKKKLAFLTPALPHFTASFIFNDKGRELSKAAGFSQEILELIESGKTNAAGHAFDLPIRGQEDLEIAQKLLRIKSQCYSNGNK